MKKTALLILLQLSWFAKASNSTTDTSVCLIVSGNAVVNFVNTGGVTAQLFLDNIFIEEQKLSKPTDIFSFQLQVNKFYTIKIIKSGYVTRTVSINTDLPQSVSYHPHFEFYFNIELFRYNKNLNDDLVDYPVAIIEYNPKREVFDYSKKYTKKIKSNLFVSGN